MPKTNKKQPRMLVGEDGKPCQPSREIVMAFRQAMRAAYRRARSYREDAQDALQDVAHNVWREVTNGEIEPTPLAIFREVRRRQPGANKDHVKWRYGTESIVIDGVERRVLRKDASLDQPLHRGTDETLYDKLAEDESLTYEHDGIAFEADKRASIEHAALRDLQESWRGHLGTHEYYRHNGERRSAEYRLWKTHVSVVSQFEDLSEGTAARARYEKEHGPIWRAANDASNDDLQKAS